MMSSCYPARNFGRGRLELSTITEESSLNSVNCSGQETSYYSAESGNSNQTRNFGRDRLGNSLAQGSFEDSLEQDCFEEDSLEQDCYEEDSLEQDCFEEDSLEQSSFQADSLEHPDSCLGQETSYYSAGSDTYDQAGNYRRERLVKSPAQGTFEEDSLEQANPQNYSFEEDSLEQANPQNYSFEEDSLEQANPQNYSFEEDSLEQVYSDNSFEQKIAACPLLGNNRSNCEEGILDQYINKFELAANEYERAYLEIELDRLLNGGPQAAVGRGMRTWGQPTPGAAGGVNIRYVDRDYSISDTMSDLPSFSFPVYGIEGIPVPVATSTPESSPRGSFEVENVVDNGVGNDVENLLDSLEETIGQNTASGSFEMEGDSLEGCQSEMDNLLDSLEVAIDILEVDLERSKTIELSKLNRSSV